MIETLKEHIYSLMMISLATGAAMIFSPADDRGTGKYIKYVISLIIIITLLLPFKDIIYMIPKVLSNEMSIMTDERINEDEEPLYDEIIEMSLSGIENMISEEIKKDHGIEVLEINIKVDSSDIENILLNEITVKFESGTSVLTADTVCGELEDEYCCAVDYVIDPTEKGQMHEQY